jgi:hypothetical protein
MDTFADLAGASSGYPPYFNDEAAQNFLSSLVTFAVFKALYYFLGRV